MPRVKRRGVRRAAPAAAAARGRPVVVLRVPRLTLRFPSLLDRYIARAWVSNVTLVLLAFSAIYFLGEFMDLIDDIQQHKVKGRTIFLYYAYHLWQIALHGGADRRAGGRAGHARPAGAAQRDHGDEGGRHQRLPRRRPGAGDGAARQPAAVRDAGVAAAADQQGGRDAAQRDQGPAGPVHGPVRPALGAGERRALLQLRLRRGARPRRRLRLRADGPGRRLRRLRPLDLRRRPEQLGPARARVREPRRLEPVLLHLRPGARLAPLGGPQVLVPALRAAARARDRKRPGRRDRAALLLQARGEAVGHDALRRAARLHRLARGAGLRRGQATRCSCTASWPSPWSAW